MKEAFEEVIKPLNDNLGKSLGIKKISVVAQEDIHVIDVKLSYVSRAGHRVNRPAGSRDFYKALGLVI